MAAWDIIYNLWGFTCPYTKYDAKIPSDEARKIIHGKMVEAINGLEKLDSPDVDMGYPYGVSCLHYACRIPDGLPLVKWLVTRGAKIHGYDYPVLSSAAYNKAGGGDIMKYLVEQGADINIRGKCADLYGGDGDPLYTAMVSNSKESIEFVFLNSDIDKVDPNELFIYGIKSILIAIEALKKRGVDVSQNKEWLTTFFLYRARAEECVMLANALSLSEDMIKYLIKEVQKSDRPEEYKRSIRDTIALCLRGSALSTSN